ncbi:alpha/beta fold hydrolase [Rhizobium gallicum]|uniref:alpha/beta fold hydrolase n=1 Tax=Rhizobium gallicum TaxID=56730 RepID=UPI0009F86E7D
MLRKLSAIGAAALLFAATPAPAQVAPFPSSFRTENVQAKDATIHVRIGGKGPAVVLLHGYGETGDMWSPMAADLARDHTVIVPDLRGLGLSSKPAGGFDKKTQAGDVAAVLAGQDASIGRRSHRTRALHDRAPGPANTRIAAHTHRGGLGDLVLRLRRRGRNEGQGARTRELLHRAGWSEALRADRRQARRPLHSRLRAN